MLFFRLLSFVLLTVIGAGISFFALLAVYVVNPQGFALGVSYALALMSGPAVVSLVSEGLQLDTMKKGK